MTHAAMTKTLYCTIATAAMLPQVSVLRDSLFAHGVTELHVLLIEHPARVAKLRAELPELRLLGPNQLGCPRWLQLAFADEAPGVAAALKPALLATLLAEGNVVYLDPEIEVFAPLTEIEAALGEADVVVTPHVSQPLPDDGKLPTMADVLASGQFNLGFVGVRKSSESAALLSAWQELVINPQSALCGGDAAAALPPGDAYWAAAFASLVERLRVLRAARFHVAAWNLSQRPLAWDGRTAPQTADGPLVFLSYAGLHKTAAPRYPQNRFVLTEDSALKRLIARYEERLAASAYKKFAAQPYSFACYTDGTPIPLLHRQAFSRLSPPNRRAILNPFSERVFLDEVVARSPALRYPASQDAVARCAELERRLNTLPHSLFGHAASAMDMAMPGSRDRVYRLMQIVSSRYGSTVGQKAGYLKQLLQRS